MKFPWQSKTLWFNILAAAIIAANQIGFADFQLSPEMQAYIVLIINIVLRFTTTTRISLQ